MATYVHLSAEECMLIYQWQREGLSQAEMGRRLELLGILPTRYQPASPHSREVIAELRGAFKERVLRTVIEEDEAVAAAPAAHGQPSSRSMCAPRARNFSSIPS